MTDRACEIGDVVAWADVPSGALVREEQRERDAGVALYSLRINDAYRVVHNAQGWRDWAPRRPWSEVLSLPAWCIGEHVTIIALSLTGRESTAELQRLAEVFEAREALNLAAETVCEATLNILSDEDCPACSDDDNAIQRLAERLHAAGWRAGDGPKRAAKLLKAEGGR